MKNFPFPLCFEEPKSDMDQVTRHNGGIIYSRPQALSGGSSLWNQKHIHRTAQVSNYKTSNSVLKNQFYPFKPGLRLHILYYTGFLCTLIVFCSLNEGFSVSAVLCEWAALSLLFKGANEPVTRMNTACPPDVKLYRATSTLLFLTA